MSETTEKAKSDIQSAPTPLILNVDENNPTVGTVKSESVTPVVWTGTFKKEDIIHIQPNCGCTANVTWEDGKVTAEFTADTFEQLQRRNKNLETEFPSGKVPFSKGMTVFLNDGEDLKVLNQHGHEVFNPMKNKHALLFNGYIQYK